MTPVPVFGTSMRVVALCAVAVLFACHGDDAGLPAVRLVSADDANDNSPVYAPDGSRVAFWSQTAEGWNFTVARADLSEPRNLVVGAFGAAPPPVWTPDGTAIAFARPGAGLFDVWIAAADGASTARQLTSGGGFEAPHQFHPDGRRLIYFLSEEGGVVAVRVLDTGTGASTPLPTPTADLAIGWWSPDGSRILYNVKDSRGLFTIWLADSAGANARQLTTEGFEYPAGQPWSPDGGAVLYMSNRTGTGDVYVYPVGASEPRQLTRDVREDGMAAWSPDGRWVTFRSNRGRQTDVWLVPGGGGAELRVTDDAVEESDLQWIPGTTTLAFTRENTARGLWVLSVADGGERRLTPDSIRVGGWDLSPDRTQLVYEIQRGGGITDLAVAPVAGGAARTIVSGSAAHWRPRWSPDGSRISFMSNRAGNQDAWVVNVAGGEPTRVTDWPTDEYAAEWAPDGTGLYVSSPRDANPIEDVWFVPLDGGEPRRLTTVGTVQEIMQSPASPDLFMITLGGREGRFVLQRLLPDGRLEMLWDRTNLWGIWSHGVTPRGDAILIDVQTESGSLSSVLVPLAGGEGRQLLGDGEQGADWSADGTQLLVHVGANTWDIGIRSLADGSTRMLTRTPDGEANARWSADGRHVVFLRETPRRQIVTVDVGKLIGR